MSAMGKMPTSETCLVEKQLHQMFSKQRHHGEWFQLDESHLTFIMQYLGQFSLQSAREADDKSEP